MKVVLPLLMLLKVSISVAQFNDDYTPLSIQDTIPVSVYKDLKLKAEQAKVKVNEPKSSVNSYMKSLYDKRFEFLVEYFNRDYFITDAPITSYLQGVLEEIYRANPQLSDHATVYVFRSDVPNAVSFGDGTIGFTLGLLARLESEAQLAFVLCHELAHYHSRRSDNSIREMARLNYDKDLQKKIREIKGNSYEQYSKFRELFESLGFSMNQHSRVHEFEADSIGLTYFQRTEYSLEAPLRTMEILDSVDVSVYKNIIDFRKFFDTPDFPFKPSWERYTKSTTWHSSKEKADSLQTHPGCLKRKAALIRQIERIGIPVSRDVYNVEKWRIQSEFEQISTNYHFKQYGKSLFQAMMMTDRYPDNAYLHAMIGENLYQLFKMQKNHELGKSLELPDPRFEENYDRFLTFIHELRLQEMASLSYYYLINGKEKFFSTGEYIYALWLTSHLSISKLDPDKVKEDYIQRFPSGRYKNAMN